MVVIEYLETMINSLRPQDEACLIARGDVSCSQLPVASSQGSMTIGLGSALFSFAPTPGDGRAISTALSLC